jgi:fructosamine-3-kinase
MMRLFGGFSAECLRAYEDVHPLREGWPERVRLHQIAPLVVHAIKFGGGYVASATEAIARYA